MRVSVFLSALCRAAAEVTCSGADPICDITGEWSGTGGDTYTCNQDGTAWTCQGAKHRAGNISGRFLYGDLPDALLRDDCDTMHFSNGLTWNRRSLGSSARQGVAGVSCEGAKPSCDMTGFWSGPGGESYQCTQSDEGSWGCTGGGDPSGQLVGHFAYGRIDSALVFEDCKTLLLPQGRWTRGPAPAPPTPSPTPTPSPGPSPGFMTAADARVDWAGRVAHADDGSVSFDWLGVTCRVKVQGASWVKAKIVSKGNKGMRGTRLRVYASDQGFDLYPQSQLWVTGEEHTEFQSHLLFADIGKHNRLITVSNIVAPQYATGITKVVSFETDGVFVATTPQSRRMEFVGDSITAATNIVRPKGAPSCGDGGFQSDWSQSYAGLLCQHFGASCSTIAVGGKCVMKECGGLQMPDYFNSLMERDAPKQTYDFQGGWAPDALVVNLGTNDMRVIKTPTGEMADRFTNETVAFLHRAALLYNKSDIEFFLTTGPMKNTTQLATQKAVEWAKAEGLRATWVDMRGACAAGRYHQNSNLCDGCATHPGIEGHYYMAQAAMPVIEEVMGWQADERSSSLLV